MIEAASLLRLSGTLAAGCLVKLASCPSPAFSRVVPDANFSKFSAFLVAGLLLGMAPDSRAVEAVSAPTASLRDGLLQGRQAEGLAVFQGIPFAAPPVGALRWREPQPVQAWNGVRKADTTAASCMQKPDMPVSAGGSLITWPGNIRSGSSSTSRLASKICFQAFALPSCSFAILESVSPFSMV